MQSENIFSSIHQSITEMGFNIVGSDENRPWGGFYVIDEAQIQKFIECFFSSSQLSDIKITEKLSPKILVVAPYKRLSWQYHHRRSEIWSVHQGPVGVVKSDSDTETPLQIFNQGEIITLKNNERHRLIGLKDWGVIAEIWQHTDTQKPSDEEDIIRLQDDFGR